jgi:phosphatidylserine/phosphatidylglycerophosphate/cardiolipin synthase-like enzyme
MKGFLFFLPIFFLFLLNYSLTLTLPTPSHPVCFYSNQNRQDLKYLVCKLLKEAKRSIDIASYHLTDSHIIAHLNAQAERGLSIRLFLDHSNKSLAKKIAPSIELHLIKGKGLMHEKLLILDGQLSLLGSANLTLDSLSHHENILMAIFHSPLAEKLSHHLDDLERGIASDTIEVAVDNRPLALYFCPGKGLEALTRLENSLTSSEKSLFLSMFTFTHPRIVESLLEAQKKHRQCEIVLDRYTAQGSSKTIMHRLKSEMKPRTSRSLALFHHKWALIDDETLILGSANWTKGAFEKNADYLLFYSPLSPSDKRYFKRLCHRILDQSQKEG